MRRSRIFYFCYSHNRPTGGQKHTYRHVDILNKHGFDATIFHAEKNFRLSWFQNETRVTTYAEAMSCMDPARDFVVVPEDLGSKIQMFPGKKVIFNKNLFHGFRCLGSDIPPIYSYQAQDVVAAFAVSEHNKRHLEFAYPQLPIYRVYIEIDPHVFFRQSLELKKPQIACILKAPEALLTLYHLVQSRSAAGLNRGKTFRWVFLGDRSEQETAQILRDSLIFIFLSNAEGLGRMPLEAMACGCMVLSSGVGPLAETIPVSQQFPACEFIRMAEQIEAIMESFPHDLSRYEGICEEGARVAGEYSLERQEQSVLSAWGQIFEAS